MMNIDQKRYQTGTMEYHHDDATLTAQSIIDDYRRAFKQVYGRDPLVMHVFAEWYQVNGETVHRVALFRETARLIDLYKHQRARKTDKSVIQRLIAKLRAS